MHVFLAGVPGVGKSTLIQRLLADHGSWRVGGLRTVSAPLDLPGALAGVYLQPGAGDAPLVQEALVGVRWQDRQASSFPAAFEALGCAYLAAPGPFDLLLMDELGRMENDAPAFRRAVLAALDGPVPALGVIKPFSAPLPDAVRQRQDVRVLSVSRENRDGLLPEMERLLLTEPKRPPRLSCGTVTLQRSAAGLEALLVQGYRRGWSLPKGRMEPGESEEQTAVRETAEETGVQVQLLPGFRRLAPYRRVERPGFRNSDAIVFFLARPLAGQAAPQRSEVAAAAWLPAAEALARISLDSDRAVLEEALKAAEQP